MDAKLQGEGPRVRIPLNPTISFIVATHREDRPLARCLSSIAGQLEPGDEVIVVCDVHDGPLPGVEARVAAYGSQFRCLSLDAGHHCYGHCQHNYAMTQARGDYIHLNDDDDVWAEGAAQKMRTTAKAFPGKVLLFRFVSYIGRVIYWTNPGRMERDYIGGHCLVTPNDQTKLGRFGCQYNGDYDWIEQTVNNFGGPDEAIWVDDIVAYARP